MDMIQHTDITIEQRKLLDAHLQLVLEANRQSNLTRITDEAQARILHIEDSLAGLEEIQAAPEGPYADLGTGAGYPGIPLAIMTHRPTLLVDSVGKKTKALDAILAELSLSDYVKTFTGRAEELALDKPGFFSVITARALSSLPSLLELASPLLKEHGHLICYKAQPKEEELQQAEGLEDKLGMHFIGSRKVYLSDGQTQRMIIVFEKLHEPSVSLPRRAGMAQKRPYKA